MDFSSFSSIVVLLFIVIDPLGLIPIVHGLLTGYSGRRKMMILARESLFALLILLFFLLVGNKFLGLLGLDVSTLNISGGILLFMVALGMVFPNKSVMASDRTGKREEPFIVPIAVPLMAGPSSIAIVLVQTSRASETHSMFELGAAVVVTCVSAGIVLILSQYILKFLGERGMMAMERLMGMILILISVQMFLDGLQAYR